MVEAVLLRSVSGNYATIDTSGNVSVNASVTANISGQAVVLGSGSSLGLSGVAVAANISGQSVFLGSGSFAPLSGLFVNLSDQPVNIYGSNVASDIISISLSGYNIITANSGGSALFSGGPVISVTLRNGSGNGTMWIAGSSGASNGVGVPLFANESLTLNVGNFNGIRAFASISGQSLYYFGIS